MGDTGDPPCAETQIYARRNVFSIVMLYTCIRKVKPSKDMLYALDHKIHRSQYRDLFLVQTNKVFKN